MTTAARLLRLTVVAALIAVSSAGTAAARSHHRAVTRTAPVLSPTTPVTRGSGYVALGDSVTFGYQEPQVVPAPNYLSAATFPGYPEQIEKALHLKVANFSCPGETAASLINASAPSNGCENGYRKLYPLHMRYTGSQLAAAITYLRAHPGVRLVSLMIGANDLFRCQGASGGCTPALLRTTLASISSDVKQTLSAVRGRAGYRGQIVILNYYSLNYSVALLSAFSLALNRAQDSAARPFHVRIADGYGEFQAGSTKFGASPCLAGLITQLGSYGTCGVHPTYAGQALLAKAVTAATLF
ncbi:MAG: SGNH/GDSL hydrolase family protein [Actinomycetota bacterium]|nr:SGNH/GDSL hydrolase family protein [Actinomycetota bacterium]